MTLDASAYLLMAKAHLMKAEEILGKPNQKGYQDAAYWTWHGVICAQKALKEIKKEEPCNKS